MKKLFLLCTGLGNTMRGFESFTHEFFEVSSRAKDIETYLFKGGGADKNKEYRLWNLPRGHWTTKCLAKICSKDPYYIEQVSFGLSLIPSLLKYQPDIIYFSDGTLGNFLWHWRKISGAKYKLLFSNGGPLNNDLLRWDHIQQVAPSHFEKSVANGVATEKQSVIPYGIKIPLNFHKLDLTKKRELRQKYALPPDRSIILSVGALNKSHKRMDKLIQEIALLPHPRPHLLLLGQEDAETDEIKTMADKFLGSENSTLRSLPGDEVLEYYQIADVFVLASLSEGLARAFLEAYSHGLPCLAHDYAVPRYILGDHGYYANFEVFGNLSKLISEVVYEEKLTHTAESQHSRAYERFSWDNLQEKYFNMIRSL